MITFLPEFEHFKCILEKIETLFPKLEYQKVTDYAALSLETQNGVQSEA